MLSAGSISIYFKKLTINFINVILPIPLQKLFTYRITEAEASFVKIGTSLALDFFVYRTPDRPPRAADMLNTATL